MRRHWWIVTTWIECQLEEEVGAICKTRKTARKAKAAMDAAFPHWTHVVRKVVLADE